MPKETFYDDAQMYDVQIGWSPEKWVQVGIVSHDGVPIVKKLRAGTPSYDFPNPCLFTIKHDPHDIEMRSGEMLASIYCDGEPNKDAEFTGLWGTFDRPAINALIRTLRRARDQAFGRDE